MNYIKLHVNNYFSLIFFIQFIFKIYWPSHYHFTQKLYTFYFLFQVYVFHFYFSYKWTRQEAKRLWQKQYFQLSLLLSFQHSMNLYKFLMFRTLIFVYIYTHKINATQKDWQDLLMLYHTLCDIIRYNTVCFIILNHFYTQSFLKNVLYKLE